MNLYSWNPSSPKNKIDENSYLIPSEELINFSYEMSFRPPNEEWFMHKLKEGVYDDLFDFSKDMIDIGACHGVYSIEGVKKFNHAYAFEPNTLYARIIGVNTILNDVVDKVDIYNVFLSDKEYIVDYNGWSGNENSNFLDETILKYSTYEYISYEKSTHANNIKLKTYILDNFNFDNIGFVKIDTEGYEYKILQGARNTLISNNYPPVLFELWDEASDFISNKEEYRIYRQNIIQYFADLGYTIQYNANDDPEYPSTHLAIH